MHQIGCSRVSTVPVTRCRTYGSLWPCLVIGTRKYECGLSWLMYDDLHRLAVAIPWRVQYKFAVRVHRCLWHRAPWYLADYCVPLPVSKVPGRQHLRSARCHQLSVPRVCRSTFRTRAFSVVRPTDCLIICRIQLLTPNNLDGTWKCICSPDIR